MSASLSAATQDRKARLAQLKSLKRKQPDEGADGRSTEEPGAVNNGGIVSDAAPSFISGRNYDAATRGPKLGFEVSPAEGKDTLERRAEAIATETKAQAEFEKADDKPLDLFKIQPKKPNWDLKRDLERKMEVLNVRTENAIARLVRERIAAQQEKAKNDARLKSNRRGQEEEGDEGVGIEGTTLVEATKEREREDEKDARREREYLEDDADPS